MKKLFLVWSTLLLLPTLANSQTECHYDVYLKITDVQDIGSPGWGYTWDLTDDACMWLPPSVWYWEVWGDDWNNWGVLPPYYSQDQFGNTYINAYGVVTQVYGTLPGEVDQYRFWFYYGCCGEEFCVDKDNTSTIKQPEGYLILEDVNYCFGTEVWVDLASQCYPCAQEVPGQTGPIKGQWWKYSQLFGAYELAPYTNPQTPLDIYLAFQGLVDCEPHTIYNCDHIKD